MERKQVILKEDFKELTQASMNSHLDPKVSHIVDVSSDSIKLLNIDMIEVKEYTYKDIDCVNLSMCSRYAGGSGRFGGIRTSINIDIDLVMKDETVLLEVINPISFQKVIDSLSNNNIEIVDIVGVVNLYQQYPIYEKRVQYLEMHFNELSKKYQLDHPRFKSRFKN